MYECKRIRFGGPTVSIVTKQGKILNSNSGPIQVFSKGQRRTFQSFIKFKGI